MPGQGSFNLEQHPHDDAAFDLRCYSPEPTVGPFKGALTGTLKGALYVTGECSSDQRPKSIATMRGIRDTAASNVELYRTAVRSEATRPQKLRDGVGDTDQRKFCTGKLGHIILSDKMQGVQVPSPLLHKATASSRECPKQVPKQQQ